MAPGVRKLALTAHVMSSVGWLGAVAASVALGVAGLVSQDPQVVRGVYLTMELMGWYVLLPLSVASLLSGLVQALGTQWRLLWHYWVLAKLLINVFAIGVLLLYMQTLSNLAGLAATTPADELHELRSPSPLAHGIIALLLLAVAATLSIYKPRGMTRYGQRKQHEQHAMPETGRTGR